MSEQIKKYQHWIVAIGAFIAVVSSVYNGVYAYARVNIKVEMQEDRVGKVETSLNGVPTIREFDAFQEEVNRRFDTLEKLLK